MVEGIEGIKMDTISGDCFVIILFNILACSSFDYLESVPFQEHIVRMQSCFCIEFCHQSVKTASSDTEFLLHGYQDVLFFYFKKLLLYKCSV